MTGFICSYPMYIYGGYCFEMTYSGPWPINRHGEPYKRMPTNAFWDAITEWESLPDDEKKRTRVGGGCVRF